MTVYRLRVLGLTVLVIEVERPQSVESKAVEPRGDATSYPVGFALHAPPAEADPWRNDDGDDDGD